MLKKRHVSQSHVKSRFNWRGHDGRIRVRPYAGERSLPECIIELDSVRTTRVIVLGAISYNGLSQLPQFKGNLNSNSAKQCSVKC
ncbi:hypothetical protein TNCV_1394121 [Trichonephila clavipes]|nr:hypothetical protein TNCV_1394121 [Trichonephila clavipes]